MKDQDTGNEDMDEFEVASSHLTDVAFLAAPISNETSSPTSHSTENYSTLQTTIHDNDDLSMQMLSPEAQEALEIEASLEEQEAPEIEASLEIDETLEIDHQTLLNPSLRSTNPPSTEDVDNEVLHGARDSSDLEEESSRSDDALMDKDPEPADTLHQKTIPLSLLELLEEKLVQDPWDTATWQSLLYEIQSKGSIEQTRQFFERLLKHFPSAVLILAIVYFGFRRVFGFSTWNMNWATRLTKMSKQYSPAVFGPFRTLISGNST